MRRQSPVSRQAFSTVLGDPKLLVLGRKNWLFAGSDAGGERAAAIYSLIETAKLNGLDPEAYLHAVLDCIADHPVNHVAELCPGTCTLNHFRQPPDPHTATQRASLAGRLLGRWSRPACRQRRTIPCFQRRDP